MSAHVTHAGMGPASSEENELHISSSSHARLPSTLYLSNLEPPIQSYEAPEDMTVSEFHDEDVQSLIEPAISPVATRLKSANTPALEKAAAMEEGGAFFDSDVETPPATGVDEHRVGSVDETIYEPPTSAKDLGEAEPNKVQRGSGKDGLYLEKLPFRLETPAVPSPWHASPKAPDVQHNQSSLAGVFSGARTRSRSGSTEALKKFLPSLPSMAQVGNLFGSSQRPSSRDASPTNESRYTRFARSATMSVSGSHSPPGKSTTTKPHTPGTTIAARPQLSPRQSSTVAQRPKVIRRSTSNDSLLYHSLLRASSLGDDTRFESQHDQVNSRVKAIRDSLQDRSSFKMPQLPSMPTVRNYPAYRDL